MRLKQAFAHAGFTQPRVYQTCGGFVLISSVERIRTDGRSFAQPGRFVDMSASQSAVEDFSLSGVLSAMFRVQPGRYRLIAIVVSDREVTFDGSMTQGEAQELSTGGATRLPQAIAAHPFAADFAVTALLYEFEKMPGSGTATLHRPPRFTAQQHLQFAGLLGGLAAR